MKTKYYRKAHIIRTINDDGTFLDEDCTSINKAKKRSAALQKASGGMGNGSLRVVEAFPKSPEGKMEKAHV